MKPLFVVLLLLALVVVVCMCTQTIHNSHNGEGAVKNTTIVPYLNHPIEKGKNLLFCSTFQIAWNELKETIIKEEIKLVEESGIVDNLNSGVSSKNDLSESDYVAHAGFGKDDILETINGELRKKFKENAPTLDEVLTDTDILAYAYLYKNLRFITEFEEIEKPLFFSPNGEGKDVRSFGIQKFNPEDHSEIAKQVSILSYVDDLDFILSLSSDSPYDEIILAMVKPEKTLLETITKVNERIEKTTPGSLKEDDVLKIPKVSFEAKHSYDELVGKFLKNEGFTDYFIAKAIQNTRFQLNQKGAIVESEAEIYLKKNGGEERYLVFSQPFLLMLREKGRTYPYLAIWFNDPELFELYEEKD
jgi:hypothetical protein